MGEGVEGFRGLTGGWGCVGGLCWVGSCSVLGFERASYEERRWVVILWRFLEKNGRKRVRSPFGFAQGRKDN